jgi:N-acetyl-anhydromuramyl-L-alanine amidase AmpD
MRVLKKWLLRGLLFTAFLLAVLAGFVAFQPDQYRCLQELIQSIVNHYPIKGIAGHSDIAPSRKTDPGPYFEWDKIKSLFQDLMYKN